MSFGATARGVGRLEHVSDTHDESQKPAKPKLRISSVPLATQGIKRREMDQIVIGLEHS